MKFLLLSIICLLLPEGAQPFSPTEISSLASSTPQLFRASLQLSQSSHKLYAATESKDLDTKSSVSSQEQWLRDAFHRKTPSDVLKPQSTPFSTVLEDRWLSPQHEEGWTTSSARGEWFSFVLSEMPPKCAPHKMDLLPSSTWLKKSNFAGNTPTTPNKAPAPASLSVFHATPRFIESSAKGKTFDIRGAVDTFSQSEPVVIGRGASIMSRCSSEDEMATESAGWFNFWL